jgi:TatD DNase family protein
MYIDSHCHINFPELAARMPEDPRQDGREQGHARPVRVGRPAGLPLGARPGRAISAHLRLGRRPSRLRRHARAERRPAGRPGRHPKIIAIGETGLDYYRLEGDLEWQRERFRTHIRASRETRKPLIIHTRSASEDTIRIMQEEGAGTDKGGVAGVMHCFTESLEVAQAAIEMGFYISFSGIVTFKSAKDLQAVARAVPLDRILIETDSPYLAPVPYRGKMNEPGYVAHVAEFIATSRRCRCAKWPSAPPRTSSTCSSTQRPEMQARAPPRPTQCRPRRLRPGLRARQAAPPRRRPCQLTVSSVRCSWTTPKP